MNLYRILFTHTAPKDTKLGIETYLLAENEDDVYHHIDEEYKWGGWSDSESDGKTFDVYDEDWNQIGTETFREKIMRIKGDMNDEDYDFSDAYYGITLYGWELVATNVREMWDGLIELGIFSNAAERRKECGELSQVNKQ